MFEPQRIVVSTDFSDNADAGVKAAEELAQQLGAELVLVHVIEWPVYPTMSFGAGIAGMPVVFDKVRENAEENLSRMREDRVARGLKCTAELRDGDPATEVVAAAKDKAADLIVIATHGHTGVKHLLVGSTTEKVVRTAPCPVLTVHAGGS